MFMSLLHETDKHAEANLLFYTLYLAHMGIMPEDLKNVYVLGHSFGEVDFEYFRFLTDATKATSVWHISCFTENDKRQVQETMKKLRFKNYLTYGSVDDCLAGFKVR